MEQHLLADKLLKPGNCSSNVLVLRFFCHCHTEGPITPGIASLPSCLCARRIKKAALARHIKLVALVQVGCLRASRASHMDQAEGHVSDRL